MLTELLESGSERVHLKGSWVEGGGVYNGYEYLMVLNHRGHRCGYVAINENHPLHIKESYNALDIDVHGGVTFFEKQMTKSECTDKWIGFDCGHAWDAPDLDALEKYDPKKAAYYRQDPLGFLTYDEVIRTKEYVEKECKKIIDQIAGE